MAKRRYGFRCSLSEGFLLLLSLLLTSSFVFLFGVYVGKAGEARKVTQHTELVRLPVVASKESAPLRPPTIVPLPADTLEETLPSQLPTNAPVLAEVTEEKLFLPPPPPKVEAKSAPPPPPKVEAKVKPAPRSPIEDSSASVEKPARKPSPPPSPPKVRAERKPASPPKVVASVKPAPSSQKTPSPAAVSPPRRERPTASRGRWSVQVQETKLPDVAQETVKLLRAQGYTPIVIKAMKSGEILYRVRIGKFRNQEDAVAAVANVRRGGKFNRVYMVSE
ncbi:MAG: SPOR domain-containing protein [Candidatus Binatia bacterium]